MIKFFRLISLCITLCAYSSSYSVVEGNNNHNFVSMSCKELMIGMIRESSFNKKFADKELALEFFFERYSDRYIYLNSVRRGGVGHGLIYANFQLDLVNQTLNIIDPDPPIPIKINKKYIPFIADKCTPDQNLYGNTGRLPDPELDGGS